MLLEVCFRLVKKRGEKNERKGSLMPEKTSGAWYIISVAAERAEVHEQTLRHYERLGLISPARKGSSPHSPRLYSDRDIERVQQIRSLMRDLGVNLAGVEAILHMKDRMEHMQVELEKEMDALRAQHANETRRLKDIIERLQQRDPDDFTIVSLNDLE
jgi:MerR family transcriptional regulator, heat shock protein HspR